MRRTGGWKVVFGIWNLEDGIWQAKQLIAKSLLISWGQAVEQLWVVCVQKSFLLHTTNHNQASMWVNVRVLNKLYYFFTHHLDTYFRCLSPLLSQPLYTSSTQPIKRTTK